MKLTTQRLVEAAHLLGLIVKAEVSGIQFEDGSGYKFNYQLDGTTEWKFIDFSTLDLRPYYEEMAKMHNSMSLIM
jgi:hypothetical protein